MKINKENIEKYAALSLCGFAMAASLVSFKCEKQCIVKKNVQLQELNLD